LAQADSRVKAPGAAPDHDCGEIVGHGTPVLVRIEREHNHPRRTENSLKGMAASLFM